jgi:hypothetical protein
MQEDSYEKKIHEADLARDIILDLPCQGANLSPSDRENTKKILRQIMTGITGNKNFAIEKFDTNVGECLGLSPSQIEELQKIKKIWLQLNNLGFLDKKKIFVEMEELEKDLRRSAEVSRIDKTGIPIDHYDQKMYQANKLRCIILEIPTLDGPLNEEQKEDLEKSLMDVMRDIAHDDNLDIDHINREDLEKSGLGSDDIDELLKIKGIIDDIEGGKLGAKDIALEIDDVMEEIKRSAEHSRLDKDAHEADDYTRKMHDADKLRGEVLHLDLGLKDVGVDQRKEIEKSVRDVMKDLAHDPTINPLTVTEKDLRKKGLSPDEISELLKLKHIYIELESDKPVDPKLLGAELEDVMEDIRKSAEHTKADNEAHKGDDYTRKMHDADKLRDEVLHIDITKKDLGVDERAHIEKSVRDIMADIAHDAKINP